MKRFKSCDESATRKAGSARREERSGGVSVCVWCWVCGAVCQKGGSQSQLATSREALAWRCMCSRTRKRVGRAGAREENHGRADGGGAWWWRCGGGYGWCLVGPWLLPPSVLARHSQLSRIVFGAYGVSPWVSHGRQAAGRQGPVTDGSVWMRDHLHMQML